MGKSCNNGKNNPRFKDLTGKIFGQLKVLNYIQLQVNNNKVWKWECKCTCGTITYARTRDFFKEKPVQSCLSCGYKRMAKTNTLPNNESLKKRIFRNYKRGAKNRNYEFKLLYEEFIKLIVGNCFYCGNAPQVLIGELSYTKESFKRNGIDRVDNTKGYTLDNSVSCCKQCNKAKMEMSYKEFTDFIKRIYKHLKLKEI